MKGDCAATGIDRHRTGQVCRGDERDVVICGADLTGCLNTTDGCQTDGTIRTDVTRCRKYRRPRVINGEHTVGGRRHASCDLQVCARDADTGSRAGIHSSAESCRSAAGLLDDAGGVCSTVSRHIVGTDDGQDADTCRVSTAASKSM